MSFYRNQTKRFFLTIFFVRDEIYFQYIESWVDEFLIHK